MHSPALQLQLEEKVSDNVFFDVGYAYVSPQVQELWPQAAFFGASVVYRSTPMVSRCKV